MCFYLRYIGIKVLGAICNTVYKVLDMHNHINSTSSFTVKCRTFLIHSSICIIILIYRYTKSIVQLHLGFCFLGLFFFFRQFFFFRWFDFVFCSIRLFCRLVLDSLNQAVGRFLHLSSRLICAGLYPFGNISDTVFYFAYCL